MTLQLHYAISNLTRMQEIWRDFHEREVQGKKWLALKSRLHLVIWTGERRGIGANKWLESRYHRSKLIRIGTMEVFIKNHMDVFSWRWEITTNADDIECSMVDKLSFEKCSWNLRNVKCLRKFYTDNYCFWKSLHISRFIT